MKPYATFDDVVDAALDEIAAGKPLDGVFALHPSHAAMLRPLLETALDLGIEHPPAAPAATRLAHNYVILQAAVERAQMAAAEQAAAEERRRRAGERRWWQRRLGFASLSMPAGVVALVVLSLSGAAAATVATTPDLPGRMADVVMGNGRDGGGEPAVNNGQPPSVPGAASAAPTDVPGAVNAPAAIDTSGVVSSLNGGAFVLTVGSDGWNVQFDGRTEVTGEIANGAVVSVLGFATAEKVIHAGSIRVTAPAPAAAAEDTPTPTATRTPNDPSKPRPSSTPTQTPQPERTPGPPPRTPKPGKTPGGGGPGGDEGTLPGTGGDAGA